VKEPLMWKLVPTLVREMGGAYSELVRGEAMITETLKLEETRFRSTLVRGLKLLDEESSTLNKGDTFSGETAFKLYDTFGFPLDLTQDALRARGIAVDNDAFAKSMAKQKADARAAWKGSGEAKTDTVWFEIRERVGGSEFLGYDTETAEGEVLAMASDGKDVTVLKEGQSGAIIVNQTPFYGESGGQSGDQGLIRRADGALFRVSETQKRLGDVFVHVGKVEKGTFRVGEAVELEVDHARRFGNRSHHSATHLLHEALRRVLGEHVAQKGSLVEPNRLRFDFSHGKGMSHDEIARAEAIANEVVLQNDAVSTRLLSVDAAIAEGAMALFGEKYGDEVRVVSMGKNASGEKRAIYSLELCGGTHVGRTGDIGLIKIVGESASSAGVRRLEALAGDAARAYLVEQDRRVLTIASALKVAPADLVSRVDGLLDDKKRLERELADVKRQLAMGGNAAKAQDEIETVNGTKFIGRVLKGVAPQDLKAMADAGKNTLGSGVVVLVAQSDDGKGAVVAGVTADLTAKFNAVDLVKAASIAMGGKGGGGRPDMAQAGGPEGAQADAALAAARALI
jgi:alanyl-tRNA synthetase